MGGQRHHRAEVYTIHRQFVTPITDSVPSSNQRSHGDTAIGSAPYLGDLPAPLCRVVYRRSRRYNALSTGGAGAGDVPYPRLATRTRR